MYNSKDVNFLYSKGLENFLGNLRNYTSQECKVNIPKKFGDFKTNEDLASTLWRFLNNYNYRECLIENDIENSINSMLATAKIHWKDKEFIDYIKVEVFILLKNTLEDFYFDYEENKSIDFPIIYYCLEMDYNCLGPLFKEPIPHIHTKPSKEPRFPLMIEKNINPLVQFFEFIYLNHFYDKWRKWAKRIYEMKIEDNNFKKLVGAYNRSGTKSLNLLYNGELHKPLLNFKRVLSEVKQEKFKGKIDVPLCTHLNYN